VFRRRAGGETVGGDYADVIRATRERALRVGRENAAEVGPLQIFLPVRGAARHHDRRKRRELARQIFRIERLMHRVLRASMRQLKFQHAFCRQRVAGAP
jgi:hypothetical protein